MAGADCGAGAGAAFEPAKQEKIQDGIKALVTEGIELDYKYDGDGTVYSVTGRNVVDSVSTFADPVLGLHPRILENLKKAGHDTPTAIQRHGMPQINAYADVMCISYTGTGKTATYLLPSLNSICIGDQTPHRPRPGIFLRKLPPKVSAPTVLILVPTRELAEQVTDTAKMFTGGLACKTLAIYGGDSLGSELGQLKREDVNVIVATPGRLIHILTEFDVLSLRQVEYLVLDEADEMFNRGFFPQIGEIIDDFMGPAAERMNIMFSATFPRQIQYYATKYLRRDFTTVVVGIIGGASPHIRQEILFTEEVEKGPRLREILAAEEGNKVLIFCNTIERVEILTAALLHRRPYCDSIHSQHSQEERDQALADFNTGCVKILVATSVAARGLNIDGVQLVINYDFPNDISDYVQRIGRVRKIDDSPSVAISFFVEDDDQALVKELICVLENAGQEVPMGLVALKERIERHNRELAEAFPGADEDLINKLRKCDLGLRNKFLEPEDPEEDYFG